MSGHRNLDDRVAVLESQVKAMRVELSRVSGATQRLEAWRRDHAAYAAVHGEGAWAAQELFYTAIDRLYRSGSLGGVRLTARRT